MAPPSDDAAFGRYAAALVKRYGPDGAYWSAHPDAPKLPITSWQVWNEPNIPSFWASGPDPAAYARLLRVTSEAIRAADPKAEVVTAGLPTSHLGMPAPQFLERMYKAGAKGSFDTLAVHAYAPTPVAVVERARALLKVAHANGDRPRLWITELGWGTAGEPGPLTVTPDKQAAYITQTFKLLEAGRAALDLRGVVVFQWRDPKPYPGRREIWPFHAGLLDVDGNPKPGLRALEQAVPKS
jgi:hypothetical protein